MHIRKPLAEELPSKTRLLLSSLAAAITVGLLAITVVLPAERGVDPTGVGERLHLTRMGLIKTAMAEADAPEQGRPSNQHEIKVPLAPGQSQEIKMVMNKGFESNYSWKSEGGPVYHDTHGDIYKDDSVFISYSKAESVTQDSGTIEAVFGGNHGWYWVNKGDKPVTITLNTDGQYLDIFSK